MAAEVLELDGLALRIGAAQRLIGADLGTKTIGLALSDVERRIATPLETIRRTKFAQGRGAARRAHGKIRCRGARHRLAA